MQEALAAYEKVIGMDPFREPAYDRLMILYRKQQQYKKELSLINKAIKAFDTLQQRAAKTKANKKIAQLSKALQQMTGLSDKKGKPLYVRQPIARWSRRKQLLEKKLSD